MTPGRRILILAPHPDDEIVGCAVAARRARAAGARVFVLYLTTGVPERDRLWRWQRAGYDMRVARRREEALAAAKLIGLEPVGFQPWPSRRLRFHLGEALALVETILVARRIDALWAPAWEGGHQDHDAANVLASRFAAMRPVMEFAEYHFAAGRIHSQRFIAAGPRDEVIALASRERALKRAALAVYRSERGNLAHIGCEVESLRPLAAHDYATAPHPGRLFSARFQWVPFRHPRIDFDPPERVRAELARFAEAVPPLPAPRAADGPATEATGW
ncbi:MAG TPA: PIG-L family deacetylase [Alphaproteobacteria bacterium]|nr:PIG-L family deacetylase [Alphaproteobacteria bacterium]